MTHKILICDDEPIIRRHLKTMLHTLGFEDVIECGDGKKAIELALSSLPDLAVIDISMPEMDGLTALAEIRKKLKLPVILLTNAYDQATAKRAAECGVDAFLTKPLRQQDLIPAIEIAIARAAEIEELREKIEDLRETIENRKIIEKAKWVLMEQENISEPDAYRSMQKTAMDRRKSLLQVAVQVLEKKS